MAKYQFIHLAKVERASISVVVDGKIVDAIFKDGIFFTDDDAVAEALQKHPAATAKNPKQRIVLVPQALAPKVEAPKVDEEIPAPVVEEDDTKFVPSPEIPEPVASAPVDYMSLTKAKLIQLCKKLGIHVHSDDNKDQIVEAIKEHDEARG